MNTKKGFSLIELAIAFAVIAIVILGIVASAGMRETARIQSAASTIDTIRSAAENYLASGHMDYTGISVDSLKTANLLPTTLIDGSNPFSGNYVVSPLSTDATHYQIDLTALNAVQAGKLTLIFRNNANSTPTYNETSSTWSVIF